MAKKYKPPRPKPTTLKHAREVLAAGEKANGYQEGGVMTFCLGKAYTLDKDRESPCWVKPVVPMASEHAGVVMCFPEWIGDAKPSSYYLYFHSWGTVIDFACAIENGIREGREGLDALKASKFVAHLWRVTTACNPDLEEEVREAARIQAQNTGGPKNG